MKAILLAGGKGTRLRPLTIHTPKPIVPIFNRPFLHYQIDLLKQVPEIDEVILSLNYQPRRIEEIFGDGPTLGIKIRYVVETGAARHRRRDQVRRRQADRIGGRVQRRRADADRSGGRHPAPPRAPRAGDHRADAGREPDGLRPGRDRRGRQRPAVPREAESRRDHDEQHQRRHLHPRAGHLRPDSERRRLVDRAELLPVAHRTAAKRSSPTSTTATGSTSARRRSTRRCTATSWTAGLRRRRSCNLAAPRYRSRPRRAHRGRAPSIEGPCFIDEGVRRREAGARIGPYSVIGRQTQVEEDAVGRRRDHLAELPHRPRGRRPRRHRRPQLPRRAQRHARPAAPCSATRPRSPTSRRA